MKNKVKSIKSIIFAFSLAAAPRLTCNRHPNVLPAAKVEDNTPLMIL